MNDRRRIVYVILGALVLFAAMIRLMYSTAPSKPPPSGPGYYTGPMKAKSGNSYGTEDGRLVPAPPGKDSGASPTGGEVAQKGGEAP